MLVMWLLLVPLFCGSLFAWFLILQRLIRKEPVLPRDTEIRARWRSAAELTVLYVAMLCILPSVWAQFQPTPLEPQPVPDRSSILIRAAVNIVLTLVLALTLASNGRSFSSFGFSLLKFKEQLAIGVTGYFAAVLPMAVSIAATSGIRGPESQHVFLKLLTETHDVATIASIAILAAGTVPFLEELLYRVILQGWLSTLCPSAVAIATSALAFCFVHGWKNGAALLPLAFILGYVFDRRHSYVSIVVIHSLYNGTILALQLLHPSP